MEWILPLLLGLLCLMDHPKVFVKGNVVEEETPVTLDCPPANVEYVTRIWFRGYFGPSDEPPNSTRLYNQISSGKMINLTARPDMSVDNSSFAMTIRRVLLEDNGYFSCSTYGLSTLQNIFFQTKVDVYIQPNITITGLDKSSHKENDTLTVACMIDRLYPQIQPANFTMRWGNTVTPTVDRNNTDGSFSYRAELTKILTKEDNGMIVTCNVSPVRGTPVSEQRTLNVQYITSGSPSISVDHENPYLEDSVTFTCDKGNVEGNPAVSTVGWYKDSHPTNWSVTSFTIKRKVTLEDTGIYTCLVGNIIGFSGFSNTVYINVSSVVNPSPTTAGPPSWLPAVAGGVAGALVLILVIGIVIFCRRKRAKDDQESSTAALSNGQTLDRVVVPPEDYGDVQYSDIPPARTKPIPAQRSFRKKPEPIYDVANINNGDEKTLYANVNGAHLPDQANPPKKPKRVPEVANNNTQNPEGVVYAELDLDKRRRVQKEPQGVMPNREEPTEYARIDFTKSARQ